MDDQVLVKRLLTSKSCGKECPVPQLFYPARYVVMFLTLTHISSVTLVELANYDR